MINSVEYVVGDITEYKFDADKLTLIPHICNDADSFYSGLALALSKKWPECKRIYHRYKDKLGRINKAKADKNLFIINMIAQSDPGGYKPRHSEPIPPIRYECLHECLVRLQDDLTEANISECNFYTGLIGSGLAQGDWKKITEIVYSTLQCGKIKWDFKWFCLTEYEKSKFIKQDYYKMVKPR